MFKIIMALSLTERNFHYFCLRGNDLHFRTDTFEYSKEKLNTKHPNVFSMCSTLIVAT